MSAERPAPGGGDLVYRQRRPVRAWHWLNALSVFVNQQAEQKYYWKPGARFSALELNE